MEKGRREKVVYINWNAHAHPTCVYILLKIQKHIDEEIYWCGRILI